MEFSMNGALNLCATCEYWVGPRQPNFYCTHVLLPQESVKGKCFCMESSMARADMYSNSSVCWHYKRWSVLK